MGNLLLWLITTFVAFVLVTEFGRSETMLKLTECQQTSTLGSYKCEAAIDGNTNRNNMAGSCSHTNDAATGWWSAKLASVSTLSSIRIYNRADCCKDRLTDFTISVDGFQCASYKSSNTFDVRTFPCDAIGREIKITSQKPALTLCEVQVFEKVYAVKPSFVPTDVTSSRSEVSEKLHLSNCQQSSTRILLPGNHNLSCDKAIDGNVSQRLEQWSCSQVKEAANGWWSARIAKAPLQITAVRIYNRIDYLTEALKDFSITVDGVECARYQSDVQFSVKTFNCHLIGQVVKIFSRKSYLSLCEVEVFGIEFSKISIGAFFTQRRVQQCLRSQFKSRPSVSLNNYVECATACRQHGSNCQGFELIGSSKRCQIFVFDKCSHKLTTGNCSSYGWVHIRNQYGLPKGKLCPSDFGYPKYGSKYKLIKNKNWFNARSLCRAENGLSKFADASDWEETAYINWLKVNAFSMEPFYLGGYKYSNGWRWVDCEKPMLSEVWTPGQPNNEGPCANIYSGYSSGVEDVQPTFTSYALCECIDPFG